MSYLKGIVVRLKTGSSWYAGTDDPLYLGVSGSDGGREFPLDVSWHDDAERIADERYLLGEVWDEDARTGTLRPKLADHDWNDPGLSYVGFEGIDRLYLRKHPGGRGDDAYQLDAIEVTLYGEEPKRRFFRSDTALWLGVSYGFQVWIPEARTPHR